MSFILAVFERRTARAFECATLGLGPRTVARRGASDRKVRHAVGVELAQLIEKLAARELPRFSLPRGIRLDRVRLELSVSNAAGERRKLTGLYPVVVEPRWASEHDRVHFAYHPERQGEIVPVAIDEPLEDQLGPFFAHAWEGLDDETLELLKSRGKERIAALTVSAKPRSVLEDLPRREGGPRALFAGAPLKGKRTGLLGDSLTERIAEGALSVGATRAPHRERLRVLLAGRGRPVVVVGPPGSGKTTLIYQGIADMLEADGYAGRGSKADVRRAFAVSGRRIIAGMSHLGDWEKRCVDLINEARRRRGVLIVDDLAHFGRIGRSRESDRSLAEFFRGPLARREILVIGACTAEELRLLEQDAPSFASLFTPLYLPEATPAETLALLLREARALEIQRHLEIGPYTLRAIVDLSATLLSAHAFPGKAIDLLRELGRAHEGTREAPARIDSRDALALVSRKTGVPEIILRREEPLAPASVAEELGRQVLGQDEAVRAAADVVSRVKAGLVDPRRPYGVLLFTGPTGTGKTELAKCLAERLYGSAERLVRFDMGEMGGPDAVARLIGWSGSPAGVLTQRVKEQPFSLVLFDEIEKAHRSVHSLLLQIFEDGRLTDASGSIASFSNTVVVMTSNLGARVRTPVGFGDADGAEGVLADIARAVREFFPPELFNRIDRIVPFRPLTREVAAHVAAKELDKLCRRRGLAERGIFVHATASVAARVAAEAFNARDGARSTKRFLEDRIGSLLAEAIAASPAAPLRLLRVIAHGDGFALSREVLEEAEPVAARFALQPLLDAPLPRLLEEIPALLDRAEALTQSEAVDRISDRIQHHLAQRAAGEDAVHHGEAVHRLDALRTAVRALRDRAEALGERDEREDLGERLEWERFKWDTISRDGEVERVRMVGGSKKRPEQPATREDVLAFIAESHALERALEHADDPSRHGCIIELYRAGRFDAEGRFEKERPGLLEQLADAYAGARGEVEAFAATRRDGGVVEGHGAGALREALRAATRHLAMRVVGLCVLDFFALEQGSQVWSALGRGPEIVRVRVLPAALSEAPAARIRDHDARQRAYDEAAHAGLPLPPNPAALLPLVRSIHFEPPRRAGTTAPLSMEDYVMGSATTVEARSIAEALAPLWLLRASREAGT